LFTTTLFVSTAVSMVGGLAFWFGVQVPHERREKNYYAKLEAKK